MRRLAGVVVFGLALSIPVLSTPVLSTPAWAGVGVWTPVGGVEPVSELLADPGDPRTLYALVSELGGHYAPWRSTDGGDSWRPIQQGIGLVQLLAVDPLQEGRIYAWTLWDYSQPKLWVSENRGDTWTLRYAAVPNSGGPYFQQIFASPVREGVLYGWDIAPATIPYAAVVYRSVDGGATWTLRSAVGTSGSGMSLLHHPTRNLLEYFDIEGLHTSQDDGLTWTVRGTFRGHGFSFVTRSAAAPDRLYAIGAEGCLARSDDGGTHWKKTRSYPDLPWGWSCGGSLSVDPTNPDRIVFVAEGTLGQEWVSLFFISRDGGATWSQPRVFPVSSVLAIGDESGTLFADGYADVGPSRSTDDGRTWTPSWNGITAGDFRSGLIALPSAGPDPVLVATQGEPLGQLLRSEDGGVTWKSVALPYGYYGLVADADGRTLYVLRWEDNRTLLLKSTDGGLTWVKVSRVPPTFASLSADPFQPGRLFAGSDETYDFSRITVWRSTGGGQGWAQRSAGLPTVCDHYGSVDICPDFFAITSDPRDPNRLVISFGFFFSDLPSTFVSADGGAHWRPAARGPRSPALALAADPAVPGVFLAGTGDGIYRSVDGGDHWAPWKPGLPLDAAVVQLLRDGRR